MPARIDLFCEDAAHESSARALVTRCAADVGVEVTLRVASARFGIPRLKTELRAFQAVVRRKGGTPDALVVLVDANRVGAFIRRREVESALDAELFPGVVIGTPDPCVERWLLADAVSFAEQFGVEPTVGSARDGSVWKTRLVAALEAGGHIVTQGGAEFAEEILSTMDLQRAGQASASLDLFVRDLRVELRRLARDADAV